LAGNFGGLNSLVQFHALKLAGWICSSNPWRHFLLQTKSLFISDFILIYKIDLLAGNLAAKFWVL
jgi:archaellum biogenesis protein FlaJ (TadC family)